MSLLLRALMAALVVTNAAFPSLASAKRLDYDPPVAPFGDQAEIDPIPNARFEKNGHAIIYFGRNVEPFFAYFERCSVNAFEKSKKGAFGLGIDWFGDYKETREGVKAIAPKAVFATKLVEEIGKRFSGSEYAIDQVDALYRAQRHENATIVGIDVAPAKRCPGDSTGSWGPMDVTGTVYLHNADVDAKCYASEKMKGSKIFKAGGGKIGFFDVDWSKVPNWMVQGYATLTIERLLDPCLK